MTYQVDRNKYPASTVVHIKASWGGSTYIGSGVIVGNNDVLTAAHVIYNKSLGGLADSVEVYPRYSPGTYGANSYSPLTYEYFDNFDPDGDGRFFPGDFTLGTYAESEIDISLLSFDVNLSSLHGSMGLDISFKGGNVGVLGYPGIHGAELMFDSGSVKKSAVDDVFLIDTDLEVNPGNSGGPIYYDYGDGPYVVGLVSMGIAAVGLEQHSDWIARAMKANDSFIGRTVNFVKSEAELIGSLDDSVIDRFFIGSLSDTTFFSYDRIINYNPLDQISVAGNFYEYTLSGLAALGISNSLDAIGSLFGLKSGNLYGARPRRGKSKKQWVKQGKPLFAPYEVKAFTVEGINGTVVVVNDEVTGFDPYRDAFFVIEDYWPSPSSPVVII